MVGIRVSKAGEEGKDEAIACDAAVLATGGFAANKTLLEVKHLCGGSALTFTHRSLLPIHCALIWPSAYLLVQQPINLASGSYRLDVQTHSPIAALLATTNGPWAQGDGLAIAQAAGAELIHMTHVQIHPTGFVNPKVQ